MPNQKNATNIGTNTEYQEGFNYFLDTNILIHIEYNGANYFYVTNAGILIEHSIFPPAKLMTNIGIMIESSIFPPARLMTNVGTMFEYILLAATRKYGPTVQVI